MKNHTFEITFIDSRTEKIYAINETEATILACAIRIHGAKSIRIKSIYCRDTNITTIGKNLQLR